MDDEFPLQLERLLLPASLYKEAPKRLRRLVNAEQNQGVPTGIALHENTWYVLQTSGQGPYIIAKAKANKRIAARILGLKQNMSATKETSPERAFPLAMGTTIFQHGMTLRDYFATHALAVVAKRVNDQATDSPGSVERRIAYNAYVLADAMLEERERKK